MGPTFSVSPKYLPSIRLVGFCRVYKAYRKKNTIMGVHSSNLSTEGFSN